MSKAFLQIFMQKTKWSADTLIYRVPLEENIPLLSFTSCRDVDPVQYVFSGVNFHGKSEKQSTFFYLKGNQLRLGSFFRYKQPEIDIIGINWDKVESESKDLPRLKSFYLNGEKVRFSKSNSTISEATKIEKLSLAFFSNPFNSITPIRYFLNTPAKIKGVIFNQRGGKIKTLVDTYQQSGIQGLIWDGRNHWNRLVSS